MATVNTDGTAVGGAVVGTPTVVTKWNFGNGGAMQPAGYTNGNVAYTPGGFGWSGDLAGPPPQCFTRSNASGASSLEHTGCRVDAYYDNTGKVWVDTGFEALSWRADVSNGSYEVDVTIGDPASYNQNHKGYVEVSDDGGLSWIVVHNHVIQSASITNTVTVDVVAGHIKFRFGQNSDDATLDRTCLSAIVLRTV